MKLEYAYLKRWIGVFEGYDCFADLIPNLGGLNEGRGRNFRDNSSDAPSWDEAIDFHHILSHSRKLTKLGQTFLIQYTRWQGSKWGHNGQQQSIRNKRNHNKGIESCQNHAKKKNNTGVAFKRESENPNTPAYSGPIMVDGKKLEVYIWPATDRDGIRYLRLSFEPRSEK